MKSTRDLIKSIVNSMDEPADFAEALALAETYLRELADLPDLLTFGIERHGFHVDNSSWLYYDPDMAIDLAYLGAGTHVPAHNHGTWEILAPYRGRVSYTGYERADDGTRPGRACLRVSDQREIGPGDVVFCPPPPHDIHAWTAETDVYLIGVFRAIRSRREYFDPDTGTYFEKEASWPRLVGK
jgi:predicted metal-dependent enzyme (double-stranded beta helix superfamily)